MSTCQQFLVLNNAEIFLLSYISLKLWKKSQLSVVFFKGLQKLQIQQIKEIFFQKMSSFTQTQIQDSHSNNLGVFYNYQTTRDQDQDSGEISERYFGEISERYFGEIFERYFKEIPEKTDTKISRSNLHLNQVSHQVMRIILKNQQKGISYEQISQQLPQPSKTLSKRVYDVLNVFKAAQLVRPQRGRKYKQLWNFSSSLSFTQKLTLKQHAVKKISDKLNKRKLFNKIISSLIEQEQYFNQNENLLTFEKNSLISIKHDQRIDKIFLQSKQSEEIRSALQDELGIKIMKKRGRKCKKPFKAGQELSQQGEYRQFQQLEQMQFFPEISQRIYTLPLEAGLTNQFFDLLEEEEEEEDEEEKTLSILSKNKVNSIKI